MNHCDGRLVTMYDWRHSRHLTNSITKLNNTIHVVTTCKVGDVSFHVIASSVVPRALICLEHALHVLLF